MTSEDPEYLLKETIFSQRYRKYDDLIRQASERYEVAPELIKAVIWRESQFRPAKVGSQGERGLMQITENAATDWARPKRSRPSPQRICSIPRSTSRPAPGI